MDLFHPVMFGAVCGLLCALAGIYDNAKNPPAPPLPAGLRRYLCERHKRRGY